MKIVTLAFLISSLIAAPWLTHDALGAQQESASTEQVTLFLAASLQPALQRLLKANPRLKVSLVPASSGLLARQIYFGAPCDIYITAHPKWSAWLKEKEVKIITQRALLSNRLALISSRVVLKKGAATKEATDKDLTIASLRGLLQGAQKIAIGDPSHVPVGTYAQQVFTALDLDKAELTSHLVPLVNTRATMLHLERAEADLGIVYLSDALQAKQASLVGLLPYNLHDEIRYDMLLLEERARELYDFLSSSDASKLFDKLGFIPLAQ